MRGMSRQTKGNLVLLFASLIWGTGFVSSRLGLDHMPPYAFNLARNIVGFAAVLPLAVFSGGRRLEKEAPAERNERIRQSVTAGLICGIVVGFASATQQAGLAATSVGKAGFITALYIIIVPIIGIFTGRKVSRFVWVCAAVATAGFYLLSVTSDFTISRGDTLCLICAVLYSVHIVMVDKITSPTVDNIVMSCVQFFAGAGVSLVFTLLLETVTMQAVKAAMPAIIYSGVMCSGVAYTLQIVGQSRTTPAVASLIMSLEAVFAAVFGWLILHESLSARELAGCALVFAGVMLSQIPLPTGAAGKRG